MSEELFMDEDVFLFAPLIVDAIGKRHETHHEPSQACVASGPLSKT